MTRRVAKISRTTNETDIQLEFCVDGQGKNQISTGVPVLNHMLEQLARHGQFDIYIDCKGDVAIDDHHSVEDIGIVIGTALAEALGDKRGIVRFAHAYAPLDEALSRVVIDLSGRPSLHYNVSFTAERVGQFDLQLAREFFQGFVNCASCTLHVDNLTGINAHHQIESIFKAFALALRQAVAIAGATIPSTKGVL